MQIIDLFSGIGGFSLAGRWMGWRTIQFCEIDKFCQRVLSYHFPGVPIHDNIKTFSKDLILNNSLYDKNEETILTGGFPCQPYSVAGKRKGNADDRHLWPYMLNTIKENHPDWIVAENVSGLITWSEGLVFNEIQTALEDEGYEVQSVLLPACGVNAPHRRYRLWIVAYYTGMGRKQGTFIRGKVSEEIRGTKSNIRDASQIAPNSERSSKQGRLYEGQGERKFGRCDSKFITDTNSRRQSCEEYRQTESGRITETGFSDFWQDFPTQSPLCGRDDGVSYGLDGITFPKWRNESIKSYGNAIVPQVVFQIFKAIQEYRNLYE